MNQQPTKRSPGRPAEFGPRVTKAVRLDPELDEALKLHAAECDLSANLLINRAIKAYLDEATVRLDDKVEQRVALEASARQVSMSLLVNHAVLDYLDHLIPVDDQLRTAS
ncbi:ribbon-helix-helix domain-containing protein [Ilumatobacter coccineus]|uniref:Uncharacterized protein n=1 Tax=Ilumatobacter coccineus (strain NBRC 103263 / KCTC 29153 / YM16-304) TaxID=1313172 RepID=A0A6C7E0H1_ILUCY|nr:hypothetical protein [Ilumatobacter coccineus]BAN00540.1 hypothetical protein YM304_02260 [Ilumatobacter coccineus YM16-304]